MSENKAKQNTTSETDVLLHELGELLAAEQWEELQRQIVKLEPADLADFIEDMEEEHRDEVFRLLDLEMASEMLVEMEQNVVDELVDELPSDQIADLAEHMAPDEAADFIAELEERGPEVLEAMEPEEQVEVRYLLQHEEDTAGGLMTSEVVSCFETETVAVARQRVLEADLSDPSLYVYVLAEPDSHLVGYLSLKELLAGAEDTLVGDIAKREFVSASLNEDQQEVARRFRKYDLWVMPVVDTAGRLVGRITVDDVLDVMSEEADEDLAHLIGAPDIEEEEEKLFRVARLRLPWLLITMFAGLINSVIIQKIMHTTGHETLAIFVPPILAMGGNTGMQSSAICVRGLALDERKYGRILTIVWREIRVGICLGLVCAVLSGFAVWVTLSLAPGFARSLPPLHLGLTVGLAMGNAMIFASCFGAVVPIVMHRLGVDPAVASGPFISTSNDLSATIIYFATCVLMLSLA